MRALLARPARHQGVRQAAGEERGRAAGAGLHPEEAGGDASRQGEEKGKGGAGGGVGEPGGGVTVASIRADPLTRGQIIWLSCVRGTHTHTILRLALTRGSRAPICVRGGEEEGEGGKNQIA